MDLYELAEWCARYSPLVSVEQAPDPECLFLDITGLEHLFGGEEELVKKVLRDFAEQGLTVRAAVADTLGAAWAIAHYGQIPQFSEAVRKRGLAPGCCGTDVIQDVGCPSPFPDSLSICNLSFVVLPPSSFSALRPLPIEALRLPKNTVDLLHQLGVRRIEQLEVLPRDALSSRFGPQLLARWDQAMGQRAEPLPAHEPRPRFEAHWSPEHPTARRETIEAALEHLLGRLAAKLVEAGRGAMRLECRLICERESPLELSVGLFQPTAWARHMAQLLQVRFERVRLPGPVQTIHLAATMTAPLERRQQELFGEDHTRRQTRHLAGLIDRLSNRLGEPAVARARLVPEAQPELACRYETLVGRRGARGATPGELPPRPPRLLMKPVCCQGPVVRGRGAELRSGQGLIFRGREHRIARSWGPERIETGWWRGRAVGRDYYRVETVTGQRLWVFRRMKDEQWFLHGTFD